MVGGPWCWPEFDVTGCDFLQHCPPALRQCFPAPSTTLRCLRPSTGVTSRPASRMMIRCDLRTAHRAWTTPWLANCGADATRAAPPAALVRPHLGTAAGDRREVPAGGRKCGEVPAASTRQSPGVVVSLTEARRGEQLVCPYDLLPVVAGTVSPPALHACASLTFGSTCGASVRSLPVIHLGNPAAAKPRADCSLKPPPGAVAGRLSVTICEGGGLDDAG